MSNKKVKKVNVNLGCGVRMIKGYINIDSFVPGNADKSFVQGDVLNIPLESNSVDYILMDQVLEHLAMSDVPVALHEIRRVLKVGGRAVICVPDFRGSVEQWLKIDHDQFFNPFLFKYLSEVLFGSQENEGQYHRCPMTAGFLNYALRMVGLHEHKLILFPAYSALPDFPGMPGPVTPDARCRNPQLVADITKTA